MLPGGSWLTKIRSNKAKSSVIIGARLGRLRLFASKTPEQVIFSGIQPTGIPHLGNYLGALQQWVRMQNEVPASTQLLYSIVDLHAITIHQDGDVLRKRKRQTLATLLAVGLDPKRSTIFYQSAVPEHTELMWVLGCMASVGSLSRMTQWKSKLALSDQDLEFDSPSAKANLKLGLFSYPVLQAADILLYGTTHVPVGEDQVQHLEFARECADQFNTMYGQTFVRPQTVLSPARRIMSLKQPHLKMSKSHEDPRSRILINDDFESVRDKVKSALTDSNPGISFDSKQRPGISNLLAIMSYLSGGNHPVEAIAASYKDTSIRDFKADVAKAIFEGLATIRERYDYYMSSKGTGYLQDVAIEGSRNARSLAKQNIAIVRDRIGM